MLSFWLVPILIIVGWGITVYVAKRTHQKNDRVTLINKKNDMLRDLNSQATKFWSESREVKEEDILSKIDKIESVYNELERDHKDSMPSALRTLRRAVTLDMESKNSFGEDELRNRRTEIKRVIDELNFQPVKFKKLF